MPKVTVISQDYDGCYSIMAPSGIDKEIKKYIQTCLKHYGGRYSSEQMQPIYDSMRVSFEQAKDAYSEYLTQITQDASEVRVYVGSDRQSYELDVYNDRFNANGSVFPALINLCKERSSEQQLWSFEPLLLSDPLMFDRNQPYRRLRGFSFDKILNRPIYDQSEVEEDPISHRIPGPTKRPMLLTQMWDAYRQNQGAESLEFHFIDDRKDLINDALRLEPQELPPGMIFKVSRFDYVALCSPSNQDPIKLGLCGTIVGRGPSPGQEVKEDYEEEDYSFMP